MNQIIFVTGNAEKFRIVKSELSKFGIEVVQKNIGVLEVQAETIEKVALAKAKVAFDKIKKPLIVMDAGMKIEAFQGFPGPYTKYCEKWFGIDKLIEIMRNEHNKKVELQWVIAFANNRNTKIFSSSGVGLFVGEKKGVNGNWFECAILDPKTGKTLGEMETEEDRTRFWGDVCGKFAQWFLMSINNK